MIDYGVQCVFASDPSGTIGITGALDALFTQQRALLPGEAAEHDAQKTAEAAAEAEAKEAAATAERKRKAEEEAREEEARRRAPQACAAMRSRTGPLSKRWPCR